MTFPEVYEDGAGLMEIASYFATSQEFRLRYGEGLSNAQFLDVVYRNVLGRQYDQAGFDYWLGLMTNGLLDHETVFWIVSGLEFKTTYPFSGTFPHVESALLTETDISGMQTLENPPRYSFTEAEASALHTCEQYRLLHTNTAFVEFGRPDGTGFVIQQMYVFSSIARAQNAVDDHRRLLRECGSRTTDVGDGVTLTQTFRKSDLDFGPLGDDSLLLEVDWTWTGRSSVSYGFYLYVVRNGNVVTITDVTERGGLPDANLVRELAERTSVRVDSLLSAR